MVRVGPVRRVGSGNLRWPELVDLQRVRGAGANKRRPAVIVTNDGANHPAVRLGRGVVTVVPVTSNVGRLPVPGVATGGRLPADHDSKAHAEFPARSSGAPLAADFGFAAGRDRR